jgi:uncharacterized protein (TIGR02996 family)
MTTGDALFAAMLADPTDQDARLVWADWLEENGLPETAAWWRGEEAERLMGWMEAVRGVSEYPRPIAGGLSVHWDYSTYGITSHFREVWQRRTIFPYQSGEQSTFTYSPDQPPMLRDTSIPGITYNPDPTPPVTDDSVSFPLTPDG